jgi:predicted transcriptional regulator
MDNATLVTQAACQLLDERGPLDFLDLADMITDETEIPVRDVERNLRILLQDGILSTTSDHNIAKAAGNKHVPKPEVRSSLER